MLQPAVNALRSAACLAFLAGAIFARPQCAGAAQRAFFIFQSPSEETVRGSIATNVIVTLTYSNASGAINNAVFAKGVSVTPPGQGVTATSSAATVAAPTFTPPAAPYASEQAVTISSTTSGASIRYTTDGTRVELDDE